MTFPGEHNKQMSYVIQAQHEHGMRPKIYAYPQSVNRKLSSSRAAAFRQRYTEITDKRRDDAKIGFAGASRLIGQVGMSRSRWKKIDFNKAPEMEL